MPPEAETPGLPSPGGSSVWSLFCALPNHSPCHTPPESSDPPPGPRAPGRQTRPAESHPPKTSAKGARTPGLPGLPRGQERQRDGGLNTDLVSGGGSAEERLPQHPLGGVRAACTERCMERGGRGVSEARLLSSGKSL